jgi:pyruvate dehydrogenase E2 component (dihydrolipoamide acetyltransferase)
MPTPVRMPQLSLTMTEGTIGKWLKREGERVARGEPLYEVETDKVINEVESPVSGVLRRIVVSEGESAPVQEVIAEIDAEDSAAGEKGAEAEEDGHPRATAEAPPGGTAAASAVSAPATAALADATGARTEGRIFVSPRARRIAEERGLDLYAVAGTGPGGRVMEKDVERAIAQASQRPAVASAPAAVATPPPHPLPAPPAPIPAAAEEYRVVRVAGMRRAIAERMSRSQQTTAAVTLTAEVDMGEAAKLREQASAEWAKGGRPKLTYTDVVVKAVARALRDHPRLNSRLVDGEIREMRAINVGVAVALKEGLIVPVVRDADAKTLGEVSEAVRDLADRARRNALSPEDVSGGTFTVTNLGPQGVEIFTPIVNWPECAILGVGRIAERAVVRAGQVGARPTMWLSLVFDHRVVDGAPAALFLARVKELLEAPYLLFV